MSGLTFQTFGWMATAPPLVGVEIAARHVTAVSLSIDGGRSVMTGHASVVLPEGAVVPSLTGRNIAELSSVAGAVREALARLPVRSRRVSLVVPDLVGKVSLIRLEKLAAQTADLEQLLRWQVRKAAPFPIEESQLAYAAGATPAEGGYEFVVVVARREGIREYEAVCEHAGVQPGVVDLASFNLVNTVLLGDRASGAAPSTDWLLVQLTLESSTLVVVRGEHVIFFRSRATDSDGDFADLIHQTTMYYEDRLGGAGFSRVVIADADGVTNAAIVADLERRLQVPTTSIDPRRAATMADRAQAHAALLSAVSPSVGAVLREWVA